MSHIEPPLMWLPSSLTDRRSRFVAVRPCGCVMSERALREVPASTCLVCQRPYEPAALLSLVPSAAEQDQMRARLDARRAAPAKNSKSAAASNAPTPAPAAAAAAPTPAPAHASASACASTAARVHAHTHAPVDKASAAPAAAATGAKRTLAAEPDVAKKARLPNVVK